jgi:hypothetical protein
MRLQSFVTALRAIYWSLMAVALAFFIWVSVPSSLILRPVTWEYDPSSQRVNVNRIIHWPYTIDVRFIHVFYHTGERNGDLCAFMDGVRPYRSDIVSEIIPVPPDVRECLERKDVVGRLSWSVLVLGFIPMRPTVMVIPPEAELPLVTRLE